MGVRIKASLHSLLILSGYSKREGEEKRREREGEEKRREREEEEREEDYLACQSSLLN